MADLSVMSFLNEETQQEAEYNLKDAQARSDISTINSKIPSNASSNNKLATISDVSAAYKPKGNATLATLPSLTAEHLNWVYNMTEDFVTTSDFAEGAGKSVKAGNEVGIFDVSTTSTPNIKYTVLGGFIDTSGFQNKALDTPIVIGDVSRTTVEAALLALQNNKEDNMLLAEPLYQEYDDVMRQAVTRIRMDDAPTANSNNPVKSSGIKNALDASVSLLDDTVGWIGGNEVDSSKGTTSGTNIFTYNSSNKTVTANGTGGPNNSQYSIPITVSGDFYFLGCPDGGAVNKYDIYIYDNTTGARVKQWDGVTQSLSNYGNTPCEAQIPEGHDVVMTLRVFAGYEVDNLVFSPMLITKEDYELSPLYRPHHESVEDWYWSENAKLGAHQLIPLTIEHFKIRNTAGVWDNNTYTVNDVTLTFEETNGYVTKVIVNGTPSANTWFGLYLWGANTFDKGDYELLGCPEGGSGSNYQVLFRENPQVSGGLFVNNYGSPVPFSISDSTKEYMAFIGLGVGVVFSNKVFTPLIRYAGDTNTECTPFAMTNRELTKKIFEKRVLTSADTLKNITETGIYGITSAPTDSPEGVSYCTLLVQKTTNGDIRQIIFKGGVNTAIYVTSYGGNPATWSSWVKFTGTVVS